MAEERGGVPLGGGADVSALGVQDQHVIGGNVGANPLERSPAGRPEGLEERDIDLHRAGEFGRGLEEAAREALDPRRVPREAVRQGVGMRIDPQAQRRTERA